jgi:S1-C subfamily serine protease
MNFKSFNLSDNLQLAGRWLGFAGISLLAGGIGGYFIFAFQSSLFGAVSVNDITADTLNGNKTIIREAKKVVVQQDDSVQSVATDLSSNLLAIVNKPIVSSSTGALFYTDDNLLAEVVPVTSDGWLVTNYKKVLNDKGAPNPDLIILDRNKSTYSIDKVLFDRSIGLYFVKIQARNLAVKKLGTSQFAKNGELLVQADWRHNTNVAYLKNTHIGRKSIILKSSDDLSEYLELSAGSKTLIVANLASEIVGVANIDGLFVSAKTVAEDLANLLDNGSLAKTVFGFSYYNQGDLTPGAKLSTDSYRGALVVFSSSTVAKNSLAFKAGLRANDFISSVNGEDFIDSLETSLLKIKPAEDVSLIIIRQGKELTIKFKTGVAK